MGLKTFLDGMSRENGEQFASRCGTTLNRLRQIAYGNEPASPELCVAVDRESKSSVPYRRVNDAWSEKKGADDTRRRIPMDWDHIERVVKRRTEARRSA